MKDALKQYLSLKKSLLKEKSALQARLAEIEKVLGSADSSTTHSPRGSSRRGRPPGSKNRGAAKSARRGRRNPVSLRDTVLSTIKGKPLTKQEILKSVLKSGYKFAAKNPMNSLNVLLYSTRQIKRANGKFSA